MKKVLFSLIALTALGMTQAHAETHNKTAEFSFTEKAFAADAGFMGLAGGRGNADVSNPKDLTKDKGNNDKGQDRNRCSGCGGSGDTNENRLFNRDFNQR